MLLLRSLRRWSWQIYIYYYIYIIIYTYILYIYIYIYIYIIYIIYCIYIYIYLHFNTTFTTAKSGITNHDLEIFASTFTVLWFWKRRDCVHVATTFTMLLSCRKNKSIFILTLLSLSIYLVVAARFTTPWSWHKI